LKTKFSVDSGRFEVGDCWGVVSCGVLRLLTYWDARETKTTTPSAVKNVGISLCKFGISTGNPCLCFAGDGIESRIDDIFTTRITRI